MNAALEQKRHPCCSIYSYNPFECTSSDVVKFNQINTVLTNNTSDLCAAGSAFICPSRAWKWTITAGQTNQLRNRVVEMQLRDDLDFTGPSTTTELVPC